MDIVKKVLQANSAFTKAAYEKIDKIPRWHAVVISCMDTRLVDFLEPAMGIKRGDVKFIKIAGNVVDDNLNDVIKSLMVCIYELEVREIIVVGHKNCGMENTTATSLQTKMTKNSINDTAIKNILPDLNNWADKFEQPAQNVLYSVQNIKNSPYLPNDIPVHGFIVDPDSGELTLLVNGYDK
ncbi:beta-class carbonic anhydrase [Pectinatus brassicae]|uniref:carbonic anhydrase n=1 Tax=Pectinatus brassicae TaxID=862415 RepID=A0A840UDQ4_9FIRM|nr:carbonic anhydrase [Pectinatus brassicae]MBB5335236.1 carbonic anhydrase [Pectinatus brassicae]